jgi:hypothetical protein
MESIPLSLTEGAQDPDEAAADTLWNTISNNDLDPNSDSSFVRDYAARGQRAERAQEQATSAAAGGRLGRGWPAGD